MTSWDQIRSSVRSRIVGVLPTGNEEIALDLTLAAELLPEQAQMITADAAAEAGVPRDHLLGVTRALAAGERVRLILGPAPRGAMRLETFILCHHQNRGPLEPELAACLIEAIVRALGDPPLIHGYLSKRSVLLTRSGKVLLLGATRASLTALMVPVPADEVERYRWLAPEAAIGDPRDTRADVYALGVLYYELLAGQPYRFGMSPAEMSLAALESMPPDVPGRLPDPRPSLIQLFSRALAAEKLDRPETPQRFFEELRQELQALGRRPARLAELARTIEDTVPDDLVEAAHELLVGQPAPSTEPRGQVVTPSSVRGGVPGRRLPGDGGRGTADLGPRPADPPIIRGSADLGPPQRQLADPRGTGDLRATGDVPIIRGTGDVPPRQTTGDLGAGRGRTPAAPSRPPPAIAAGQRPVQAQVPGQWPPPAGPPGQAPGQWPPPAGQAPGQWPPPAMGQPQAPGQWPPPAMGQPAAGARPPVGMGQPQVPGQRPPAAGPAPGQWPPTAMGQPQAPGQWPPPAGGAWPAAGPPPQGPQARAQPGQPAQPGRPPAPPPGPQARPQGRPPPPPPPAASQGWAPASARGAQRANTPPPLPPEDDDAEEYGYGTPASAGMAGVRITPVGGPPPPPADDDDAEGAPAGGRAANLRARPAEERVRSTPVREIDLPVGGGSRGSDF